MNGTAIWMLLQNLHALFGGREMEGSLTPQRLYESYDLRAFAGDAY